MGTLSTLKVILKQEPEEWLAYIHGQKLDDLESYRKNTPRFTGVALRTLGFFVSMLRIIKASLKLHSSLPTEKPTFFIYSGTVNQSDSLKTTTAALVRSNEQVYSCTLEKSRFQSSTNQSGDPCLPARPRDLLLATGLFLTHAPRLYRRLHARDPLLTRNFFTFFINSYFYLAVFYRILNKIKPEFVIVSNDHNVDCRSLLAVARHLGIKTVYMQHASVSNVFPALTVDYAFLDGQSALDTYKQCEKNLPPQQEDRRPPIILLNGQKKPLEVPDTSNKKRIGVAANMLDNPIRIAELIDYLVSRKLPVSLRCHPRQAAADIAIFREKFSTEPLVKFSEPGKQIISDYLGELSHLISGNSSIHLEAAIAGVTPIYHEVQPPFIEDYYGYVRHGLARRLDSPESIVEFFSTTKTTGPDPSSVRFYSATYGTEWHGKEGELVAQSLLAIRKGAPTESLWGYAHYRIEKD